MHEMNETLRSVEIGELIAYNRELARLKAETKPIEMEEIDGKPVAWRAYPGSQTMFIKSPAFETLFHGTRGPGKTDALLMAFAQHCGKDFGAAWRGLIIRRTYKELADVVTKSQKWFPAIFPDRAKYNKQDFSWEWEGGEKLMFRHLDKLDDYHHYHGHEYPFMGFEELTNWGDPELYELMISLVRTSTPGVPRMVRATCNPYGPGHNWVRERFRLTGKWWETQLFVTEAGTTRCAIYGNVRDNKHLLNNTPDYERQLRIAAGNPARAEAWLVGSWDITSGGMFDDIWTPAHHVVPKFDLPGHWPIVRAYDYGDSRPFSVGWYTQAREDTEIRAQNDKMLTFRKGDIIRVREYYGWTGKRNQGLKMPVDKQAAEIIEREKLWDWHGRVQGGVADSQIFVREGGRKSISDMFAENGIHFMRSEKGRGSRAAGWAEMRRYLLNSLPDENGLRPGPGFFIIGLDNSQFLETVPTLPRDEKNSDDVDTDAEDHIADEVRYLIRHLSSHAAVSGRTTGDF